MKIAILAVTFLASIMLGSIATAAVPEQPRMVAVNQIPNDTTVKYLMSLMQVEKSFEAQFEQANKTIIETNKQLFGEKLLGKNLTANQQQRLKQVFANFGTQSLQLLNTSEYRLKLLAVYATNIKNIYTQQEVDAMIEFYSSKMGQSIAIKQPSFDANLMQQISPITIERQQTISEKLLPQVMQEVSSIFDESKK